MSNVAAFPQTKPPETSSYQPSGQSSFTMGRVYAAVRPPWRRYPSLIAPVPLSGHAGKFTTDVWKFAAPRSPASPFSRPASASPRAEASSGVVDASALASAGAARSFEHALNADATAPQAAR